MNLDLSIFRTLLQGLVLGGAGALSSWLLEKWPAFQKLKSEYKLYGSYIVTGLIGIAAYFGMLAMQYVAVPVGYVAWIETLVAVAFTAAGVGQVTHRVPSLRKKDRIVQDLERIEKCCGGDCS